MHALPWRVVRCRRGRGAHEDLGAQHPGARFPRRREGRDAEVTDPKITPELVQEHNLTPDEYARIVAMLGRTPTFPELGIFSALWSEHCSYKHSRPILKTFPTTGPQVVQGPGENAGVLRLPGGWAVAFKIESHNHPSAVEPYQGAATGVGGILRDVFTMGARPVALLNSLRFGPLADARNRYLCAGVVRGVGDYGHCVCLRGADARERGTPPAGAGRRSLHGEAAARGEPRADRLRPHRRDPGHGRGGPHLLLGRDGRAGRRRRGD